MPLPKKFDAGKLGKLLPDERKAVFQEVQIRKKAKSELWDLGTATLRATAGSKKAPAPKKGGGSSGSGGGAASVGAGGGAGNGGDGGAGSSAGPSSANVFVPDHDNWDLDVNPPDDSGDGGGGGDGGPPDEVGEGVRRRKKGGGKRRAEKIKKLKASTDPGDQREAATLRYGRSGDATKKKRRRDEVAMAGPTL